MKGSNINILYLSFSSEVCEEHFHLWPFLLCLATENDSVLQYSELQQEEHQGQEYGHYKDFQLQGRHPTPKAMQIMSLL